MKKSREVRIAKKVHDVRTVVSVAAFIERNCLVVALETDDDKTLNIAIPHGAVGHLVARLKAEHMALAIKAGADSALLQPLTLTGARPAADQTKNPALMLQFDNVFELGVVVPPQLIEPLERVVSALKDGPPDAPPKVH